MMHLRVAQRYMLCSANFRGLSATPSADTHSISVRAITSQQNTSSINCRDLTGFIACVAEQLQALDELPPEAKPTMQASGH